MTNSYGYNSANADQNANNTQGNNGANSCTLLGCRLAGPGNYIPAYTAHGSDKIIQAQCKFAVFQNIRNKRLKFDITAWGKLADAIAKYGATGKEITIIGEMNSYRGRVWLPTPDGAPRQCVTLADGQPLMIDKVGITIKNMKLGNDSDKTVQEEISAGMRPQGWNDSRSPGKQQWLAICEERKHLNFQPGMTRFGYARVSMPEKGNVVTGGNVANQAQGGGYGRTGQAQMQQPNGGYQQGGYQQNGGYQQSNMQQQVQSQQVGGYGQQQGGYQQPAQGGYGLVPPQQNANPGQPVDVNGQHMGYSMAQSGGYGQHPAPNGGYGQQPIAGGGGYQQSNVNM